MEKRKHAIVGERLAYLIEREGLSQKELAVDVHMSQSALSNYICNRRSPDANKLLALARYFDTTTDYLIGLNDTEKGSNKAISDEEMAFVDLLRNMPDDTRRKYFEIGKVMIGSKL